MNSIKQNRNQLIKRTLHALEYIHSRCTKSPPTFFSALHGCHPGGRVIGVTWGGECPSNIFLPINRAFLLSGRGTNKNCECFLNECFCGVKTEKNEHPAFKEIFPILLTWLLRELKFVLPCVDFAPSSVIRQVTRMGRVTYFTQDKNILCPVIAFV